MRIAILALASAASTQASILTFQVNSSLSGEPVNAAVAIELSANRISVNAENFAANPTSVKSVLTSIEFTLSGGAFSDDAFSSSAILRTIAKGGTYTDSVLTKTDWIYARTGNTILLSWNAGSGPDHGIIGPAGPKGTYSSSKGSIAGNAPHNPFIAEEANFLIELKGASVYTGLSDVKLGFNTTGTDLFTATCTTSGGCLPPSIPPSGVPEPSTYLLLGTGLAAVLGWNRFRTMEKR
jgi:hypothetical protein